MKYASAQPYTESEREADRARRRRLLNLGVERRKATPSGQNYNIPGDKASKAKDQRILGE